MALVANDDAEAAGIKASTENGGDGDLLEVVAQYRQCKRANLEAELEASKHRPATDRDLLEVALAIDDSELANFQPTMHRHAQPATPRQLDWLSRLGIQPKIIRNKGHASAIIDRLSRRRAANLATLKQVRQLRRFGVPDAHLVTFSDATEILGRYFTCSLPIRK